MASQYRYKCAENYASIFFLKMLTNKKSAKLLLCRWFQQQQLLLPVQST